MRLLSIVLLALAVVAVSTGPLASAATIAVPNSSFEEGVTEDGAPRGWPERFGRAVFGDSVTVSQERAVDGRHSVKIEDRLPDAGLGVRSARIPATPGRRYTATVQVFIEQGNSQLYLEFWNDAGTRIYYVTTTENRTGEWHTLTASAVAPEGATAITLLLYGNIPNTGVAYFDVATLESDE